MEEQQYCGCSPVRALPVRAYYSPLLHPVGWSGEEMEYDEICMGGMEEK